MINYEITCPGAGILLNDGFQEEVICQSRHWTAHRRDTGFPAGGDLICPIWAEMGLEQYEIKVFEMRHEEL